MGDAPCIAYVLILLHAVLLAHLEDAAVVHQLVDERALVVEVVDVIVLELVEKGKLPVEDGPLGKVILPYLLGHLLVQDDDWQHVGCPWEVVARGIDVDVLE